MDESLPFLIVGLGNPGDAYEQTRHNVGFAIIRSFAKRHGAAFKKVPSLNGELSSVSISGKRGHLLLPTTFMNASGEAVRKCIDYYRVPLDRVLIVCDDVALPVGVLRMRSQGSCGGHNGLRNIETHLNTQYYPRLRVGVGGPGGQILADYVLGRFSKEESEKIQKTSEDALGVLELWVTAGIAAAMQNANKSQKEEGDKNG